jgi:hypothetical protein
MILLLKCIWFHSDEELSDDDSECIWFHSDEELSDDESGNEGFRKCECVIQ